MPIIESIQVASVAVPLDKVTSFSTRTVSERHYCLVKVRGKDGNEGIGFCYVGSAGGDIAKLAVEQLLASKLIGQNSHRSEGLWMEMYNESILQGRAGAVMRGAIYPPLLSMSVALNHTTRIGLKNLFLQMRLIYMLPWRAKPKSTLLPVRWKRDAGVLEN